MLKILQRRVPVELDEQQTQQFHQQLQGRFHSLLAGVRLEYLKRLGLELEILHQLSNNGEGHESGELFMPEPGTIYFVKYTSDGGELEAGAISKSGEADFEEFFSQTHQCLTQVANGVGPWLAADDGICQPEGAQPADVAISEKEMEAAKELMSRTKRELLAQIATSDSVPANALDLSGTPNAYALLADFEDLDLIRKDYAVIDQKTGQQILRVPSRASLEEAAQKFFIGGTAVTEDNVDEVISCTPFCRELLKNDQWLLYLLFGTLNSLSIGNESIQVCQDEGAATRVFLTLNGQRFMIVLCNRRLTLDDSYLINAQIAAYELKDVVVVSTDRTSTLMRHHLSQTNPDVSFDYVDSLENLEQHVRSILLERQRDFVKQLLNPLAELTSVPIEELVARKMMPPGAEGEEEDSESFQAVADSMEIPAEDLPSLAPPTTEPEEPEPAPQRPQMLEVEPPPTTEDEDEGSPVLELPNADGEFPVPNTEDTGELPEPMEEVIEEPAFAPGDLDDEEPQLAIPDLVPDLPAEEFVPEIPNPLEVGAGED